MLRITLVLFIVGGAVAQIKLPKSCPNFKTVKNFDVQRYMGKWYEFAKYTAKSSITDKCVTANNTLDGSVSFKIENTLIPLKGGKLYTTHFTATPSNNLHDGKFTITPGAAPYWVLNTDYDNWAILWSCGKLLKKSTLRTAWIYTRVPYPSDEIIGAVYAAAAVYRLSKTDFIRTNKEDCPDCY